MRTVTQQLQKISERPLLALSGIIGLFVALGSVYLWLIPPFEGPDEAQHYAYIRWLINERTLPPQGPAAWETGVEQESGQPPLYYFLASLPARLVGIDNPPAVYRPNPYFVAPLPRAAFDHDNRAIYYPYETHPLRGGWLALYLARYVTLAFGVLLIVAMYGLARQLWPATPGLALSAAALTAATPQVLYIGSMASNDIPAAALSTLTLWLFAIYLRQPERNGLLWGGLVGASLGAAALTKVSALILGFPVILGLLWLWRGKQKRIKVALTFTLAFGIGLTAVFGWWLLYGWLHYGSPLGLEPHDQTHWAIPTVGKLDPFLLRWQEVWRSYWLSLGWGTIRWGFWPGGWPYAVFFSLLAAALAGWLRYVWEWRRPAGRLSSTTLLLFGLLTIGLVANVIMLESWMQRVIAPYGRLLFPSIGAITLLLFFGWHSIHPRLASLALAFTATIALLTPPLVIYPAYTQTFLSADEIAALPPAPVWRFGETTNAPFAELLLFSPRQKSLNPSDVLQVDLCWRALATVKQDYSLALQIIGPANSLITSRRAYPGMGRHPTSLWQVGQVWCDSLHVAIPKTYQRTLAYELELFFLTPDGQQRLAITDGAGNSISNLFIGRARLVQPATQYFAHDLSSTVPFHLVEVEFAPIWKLDLAEPVTMTWAAATPTPVNYQVFAHLRQEETGAIVAQADGPPVGGWYPTSWWEPGELVQDVREFSLPTDLAPGTYQLVVGLYDLADGTRPIPEINLGQVEVVP